MFSLRCSSESASRRAAGTGSASAIRRPSVSQRDSKEFENASVVRAGVRGLIALSRMASAGTVGVIDFPVYFQTYKGLTEIIGSRISVSKYFWISQNTQSIIR